MDLIKITPDKEKARSILKMTALLLERINKSDKEKFASLIITDYYEIIKELLTAILLIDGYKTLSHKDLLDYVKEGYKEFSEYEISLLDELRVLRNRIAYDGFFVETPYLKRKEPEILKIIKKLHKFIENKV